MTDNVVITLACGTNNPNRATRAVHLATVAHKEGKNVTLFLLDEAVYIAKEGLALHCEPPRGMWQMICSLFSRRMRCRFWSALLVPMRAG
jgi:predicted peroxiredoxin